MGYCVAKETKNVNDLERLFIIKGKIDSSAIQCGKNESLLNVIICSSNRSQQTSEVLRVKLPAALFWLVTINKLRLEELEDEFSGCLS